MKHLNIVIFGRVQGVFFRDNAKEQADKSSIKGFTKNMPDGSVYIEAEGQRKNLNEFVKWCYIGPSMAQVEKVEISDGSLKSFEKFEVC